MAASTALTELDESSPADPDCRCCGYNLRGLSSDAPCPECGLPVRASGLPAGFAFPSWRFVRRARAALYLFIIGVLIEAVTNAAFHLFYIYWLFTYWLQENPALHGHVRIAGRIWGYSFYAASIARAAAFMLFASPWLTPRPLNRGLRRLVFLTSAASLLANLPWEPWLGFPRGRSSPALILAIWSGVETICGPASLLLFWWLLVRSARGETGGGFWRIMQIFAAAPLVLAVQELLGGSAALVLWLVNPTGSYSLVHQLEAALLDLLTATNWWRDHVSPIALIAMLLAISLFVRRMNARPHLRAT